jgi:hypothetical protein
MSALDQYEYLASSAAELLAKFPTCGDYIYGLLEKYKKTLKEDLVDIGASPAEVCANFENDVRKHCTRAP